MGYERIAGQITGFQIGFRNGEQAAEFIDQDGTVLTWVPRRELEHYMTTDGTSLFHVAEINGVKVWEQLVAVTLSDPDSEVQPSWPWPTDHGKARR
jgi:hypothetical protein